MARQGFISNNNEPYVYQEGTTGISTCFGIDSTGILSIGISSTANIVPISTSQIVIDPAADIKLTPTVKLLITGPTEMTGNLKIDTLTAGVMQTDASGNVSSSNGTNGQLLIGGGAAPVWATLTSSGGSVTITNGANSINLEAAGVAALTQLDGDTGSALPVGGVIVIAGGNLVTTTAAADTVTVDVSGGTNGQVIVGATAGSPAFATLTSTGGTITYTLGANTLNIDGTPATTTQQGVVELATSAETITGADTTRAVTPSGLNAKLGAQTLRGVIVGGGSTAALSVTSAGSSNQVLLGNTGADPFFGTIPNAALDNSAITLNNGNNITVTGSPVSLGGAASIAVTGTTNRAVQVGNASGSLTSLVVGTNGQVLLGSTGANPAFGTLTTNSAANIVYVTGAAALEIDLATSILLPATTGASAGVIALGTDRTTNRFIHNYGTNNTFVGEGAGNFTLTTSENNTCVGYGAGASLTSAAGHNTYIGYLAGNLDDGSGGSNVAVGHSALNSFTGAATARNVALGTSSLTALTSGRRNLGLGHESGTSYTTETDNICIGYQVTGTAAENNVCRIGNGTGTSNGNLNQTFIMGIAGRTVSSSATVLINTSTGQLGTVVSSRRFKMDIDALVHSPVLDLEPVTFRYKENPAESHYGLIAEQVEQIMPDMVVYNEGMPETVRYHELPILLLAELRRLSQKVEDLERRLNG